MKKFQCWAFIGVWFTYWNNYIVKAAWINIGQLIAREPLTNSYFNYKTTLDNTSGVNLYTKAQGSFKLTA